VFIILKQNSNAVNTHTAVMTIIIVSAAKAKVWLKALTRSRDQITDKNTKYVIVKRCQLKIVIGQHTSVFGQIQKYSLQYQSVKSSKL